MVSALGIKICILFFPLKSLSIVYSLLGGDFVGIASLGIFLHMYLDVRSGALNKRNMILWSGILISLGHIVLMCGFWRLIGSIIGCVLFALCIKGKGNLFECKLFLFFGKISYPLYLCHQNIAYVIEYKLMVFMNAYNFINIIIAFLGVVIIAIILYYIEKNMIKIFLIRKDIEVIKSVKQ